MPIADTFNCCLISRPLYLNQLSFRLLDLLLLELNLLRKILLQLVLAQLCLRQILFVLQVARRHICIQFDNLFNDVLERFFEDAATQAHIYHLALLLTPTCLGLGILSGHFWFLYIDWGCLYDHLFHLFIFFDFVSLNLGTFCGTLFGGLGLCVVNHRSRILFFLLLRRHLFNLTLKFLMLFVLFECF